MDTKKIKSVPIDSDAANADWLHKGKGKQNGDKKTDRSKKADSKTK